MGTSKFTNNILIDILFTLSTGTEVIKTSFLDCEAKNINRLKSQSYCLSLNVVYFNRR
jgi:hypothetical protein